MVDSQYIVIENPELNAVRIASVEKMFGFKPNTLVTPKRILIGDGVLWKHCRRKIKIRRFFLFNDLLLYGDPWPMRNTLKNPFMIDLVDAAVEIVRDNTGVPTGFSILSPKRSFVVTTYTPLEAQEWIMHLVQCISASRYLAGRAKPGQISHSPIWIQDSEASRCMACRTAEFNFINRRHHCRHCGKLVCGKCSAQRAVLPYQGAQPVRVCDQCHVTLKYNLPKKGEVAVGDAARRTAPKPPEPSKSPTSEEPERLMEASTFYSGKGANLPVPLEYEQQTLGALGKMDISEDGSSDSSGDEFHVEANSQSRGQPCTDSGKTDDDAPKHTGSTCNDVQDMPPGQAVALAQEPKKASTGSIQPASKPQPESQGLLEDPSTFHSGNDTDHSVPADHDENAPNKVQEPDARSCSSGEEFQIETNFQPAD